MSRYKDGNEITLIYYGKKAITVIYKGLRMIWQSISSCFGAGYWDNDKPWNNDDGWRND
jgi:hypothetical protein